MWAGSLDPAHAVVLVEQLRYVPESRLRAAAIGSEDFIGWGPTQFISADIADLIQASIFSQAGKRMPNSARYPRPQVVIESDPMTIADFNPDLFMGQLSS